LYADSAPSLAPVPAPAGKDAERIHLPLLPPDVNYETWKFQAVAGVLAAAARPQIALAWLHQVDDQNIWVFGIGILRTCDGSAGDEIVCIVVDMPL
jgi:hypothetical protein